MKREVFEKESLSFAQHVAFRLQYFPEGGKIIILEGEMGTGKTTFTRFLLESFQIFQGSSPSFSLAQVYKNQTNTIIHFDFQRIGASESMALFEEYEGLYPDAFFIIEWPFENWKHYFTDAYLHLQFFHGTNSSSRIWEISFYNPQTAPQKTIQQLLKDFKTPIHIQKHSAKVTQMAVFCAEKLEQNHIPIDVELVKSAAMLHDCVKYIDFKSFEEADFKNYQEEVTPEKIDFWKSVQKKYAEYGHEKAMKIILDEQGYSATGKLVESHRSRKIYEAEKMSWEEKCVYYADKRALHDQIVSLQTRLIDGAQRYGRERNLVFEQLVFNLEKELMTLGRWE